MATDSTNYWPDSKCARAFWGQQELPPYRLLLADTVAWLEPRPDERWLDLGCGRGNLSEALWLKSGGALNEMIGVDCAAVNEKAYARLRERVQPRPAGESLRFVAGDMSRGLSAWEDGRFDGVVSGLAIQYAEFYCHQERRWTMAGYDSVLAEVFRVLRPGGSFVFSVNVPDPAWGTVARAALKGVVQARRPLHFLKTAWRIWSYGSWLKREARRGRFHYLPANVIEAKLAAAGFAGIEHRLSFCDQAYLFRCNKPVAAQPIAA